MTQRPVALITGASMGLGAEYARQLAALRHDLILVARSEDRLCSIAEECRKQGVKVLWYRADLTQDHERQAFIQWALACPDGLATTTLINNAGFGDAGPFDSMGRDRVQDMIRLNILALTDLTHGLLPLIKKAPSGQGRIVLISSVASYQPIPYFAVYAATKAFVTHLGEALYEELHKEGIQVTTICPGVTKTEFGRNGQGLAQHFFDRGDTAASVVQKSIRGIERGAVVVNTADQIRIVLSRLVPRFLVRKIAALIARRLLAQR